MAKKNFGKLNFDLGGLRDVLTDTISTVADKVLDLADAAADTAKSGQQLAKLYVEKKKEESALEDAYKELGKLYYELHKQDAQGVLADLCMEIENTLVNIEDITAEIDALKEAVDADIDDIEDLTDLSDDDFEPAEQSTEEEGFLERMADTLEDALEGLDEAIENALDKLEVTDEVPAVENDDIEVTVEEYLNDDDFAAPQPDEEIEVEVLEEAEDEPAAEKLTQKTAPVSGLFGCTYLTHQYKYDIIEPITTNGTPVCVKGKRNMKKLIALLLSVVLACSLVGCGGPEILGTYKTTADVTDLFVESFDEGTGLTDPELSLANYMDSFTLVIISEFKEDGTYVQYLDSASTEAALDALAGAIVPLTEDLVLYTLSEQFRAFGYSFETKEDVETFVGMAWDDIINTSLGMSLEEFAEQLINELVADTLTDEVLAEGNYKAEKGKLYISESLDTEISEGCYETYEINGDVITVTGGVNIEETEILPYPFDLVKVAEG